MAAPLARRLLAEFVGSVFLAAVVVGSGIAAARLTPGNVGLQLFENAAATAAGLFAIILMVGPVSGAHFNPVVSFVDAAFGGFSDPAITLSTKHRASGAHWLAEVVATIGLLLVIFSLVRSGRSSAAPAAVGSYIGAAYFFTSSTSFANPAITVGRMFSNTFAGIQPASAPGFVIAQLVGGLIGFGLIRALYPGVTSTEAADIVVPHGVPAPNGTSTSVSA
jgi:glycerol uptake facilitator-like aquaporin